MAIDTERKRKSVGAIPNLWNGPVVVPDGTIAGEDRQAIAGSYSGIPAENSGDIDTEQKRKSAATTGMVWQGVSVIPDAAINKPDRQHAGWSYSAIPAQSTAVGKISRMTLLGMGA